LIWVMVFMALRHDPISCVGKVFTQMPYTGSAESLGFDPVRRRRLTCPIGAGSRAEEG
jgi:hypothetical protein